MSTASHQIRRIGIRWRQGLNALRPVMPPSADATLRYYLSSEQRAGFTRMNRHDQAHSLRACDWLMSQGVTTPDLITATLLHDLGKAGTRLQSGRPRLLDRVFRVILGRFAPHLLARLARPPAPWWRAGLTLAVHHAALGAEQARDIGCSPRVCWLIAHHDVLPAPADPELALLRQADAAAR